MKIYTKKFCPNCDEIKEVLSNNNIKYEERDVDYFKNKAKLVVRGFKDLPVIENNNEWVEFTSLEETLNKIGIKIDS